VIRVAGYILATIQLILLARFYRRTFRSLSGEKIESVSHAQPSGQVSVILPVLNEEHRIRRCLETLITQGNEVRDIVVVDGGSTDSTRQIAAEFSARDARVTLIPADPIPVMWNGKAWGLQCGLEHASPASEWVITVDADVLLTPDAVSRVVAFAEQRSIPFLSIATSQRADTSGLSFVHPALLSTLVYRFGAPGNLATRLDEVQANGQFALYKRVPLYRLGGFAVARDSICEDVTVARHLYLAGYDVGFYEGDDIAETVMYPGARECLENWPRSLSLKDRYVPRAAITGLANLVFLQVVPLLVLALASSFRQRNSSLLLVNRILLGTRIGIMFGTRRAYSRARWTYWFSPLADPVSLIAYLLHLGTRRHYWRGRPLVNGDDRP
jgi:dolichol-phosphate mannosyltransferase